MHDIDITIPAGQFVAVVGPSGCGKTTILNMLAGLLRPTVGSVKRHGTEVDGPSRDIGYMLAPVGAQPVAHGSEERGARAGDPRGAQARAT